MKRRLPAWDAADLDIPIADLPAARRLRRWHCLSLCWQHDGGRLPRVLRARSCARPAGHTGRHFAVRDGRIIAVWPEIEVDR